MEKDWIDVLANNANEAARKLMEGDLNLDEYIRAMRGLLEPDNPDADEGVRVKYFAPGEDIILPISRKFARFNHVGPAWEIPESVHSIKYIIKNSIDGAPYGDEER